MSEIAPLVQDESAISQDSMFCTPDPGENTNPGESTNLGEDADPGLSAPGTKEGNKTDKVADPGFVATAGVGNTIQQ
jgi:hypothetical protein